MACQGNGFIDFSSFVFDSETALYKYAVSPQLGLQQLQSCLMSFQHSSQSITILEDDFYQRLSSVISSVEYLLSSGSPYFKRYHIAFMSACDALFQVVIASQFSLERMKQSCFLLSIERSCWTTLFSNQHDASLTPVYVTYETPYSSDDVLQDKTIDYFLNVFSAAGRVSFHVDSMQGSVISGRYELFSVQSIDWLRLRFPGFDWAVVSVYEDRSFKALCELSFLPIFQNQTMPRSSKYQLLELFESQLKKSCYRPFGAFFMPGHSIIYQDNRMVSIGESSGLFNCEASLEYFPIRYRGFVYIASKSEKNKVLDFSLLERLGADFLPQFLYELTTSFGSFVFDSQECIGLYPISNPFVSVIDGVAILELDDGVEATVILNLPIATCDEGAFCILPMYIDNVLVINQAEAYFAIPFLTSQRVEAVCSKKVSSSSVKNIWLSNNNKPMVEPWLFDFNHTDVIDFSAIETPHISCSRGGFYHGVVGDLSFWIDA